MIHLAKNFPLYLSAIIFAIALICLIIHLFKEFRLLTKPRGKK